MPPLQLPQWGALVPGRVLPAHWQRRQLVSHRDSGRTFYISYFLYRYRYDVASRRLRVYDLPQDSLDVPASASTAADSLPPSAPLPSPSTSSSSSPAGASDERLHPADSIPAALRIQEGETVYSMAWYPGMTTSDPATCCFATSSRVRG